MKKGFPYFYHPTLFVPDHASPSPDTFETANERAPRRPTSASNAVSTPSELTDAEFVANLWPLQLPVSPRNQRPPGQNGLQSRRRQQPNHNDDRPATPCIWQASVVVQTGVPYTVRSGAIFKMDCSHQEACLFVICCELFFGSVGLLVITRGRFLILVVLGCW